IEREMSIMSSASLLRWLRSGFQDGRTGSHPRARGLAVPARRRSSPMRVEALEGRIALSTIVVNQVADKLFQAPTRTVALVQNPGAPIRLPDAINIASNSPGPDTIVLQPARKPFPTPNPSRIYNLDKIDNYWYGPDGLPAISSVITIQGNG